MIVVCKNCDCYFQTRIPEELFFMEIFRDTLMGEHTFKCTKCGKENPIIFELGLKGDWRFNK